MENSMLIKKIREYPEIFVWFLCAFFMLTAGCTRPQAETSEVAVELPAVLSASSKIPDGLAQTMTSTSVPPLQKYLMHVVINVSGEGMEPIVESWSGRQAYEKAVAENSTYVPKTVFTLPEINSGNRLVQLVAVYVDSTDNGDMYYAEEQRKLALANESVTFSLSTPVASNENFSSGRIAGRYYGSGGSTDLWGQVNINYRPPAGSARPITIEKGFIASGWFQFFALANIPLDYVLNDGTELFSQKNLSSGFTVNDKVIKALIPAHKIKSYSNPSVWERSELGHKIIYGQFGDVPSDARSCFSNLAGDFGQIGNDTNNDDAVDGGDVFLMKQRNPSPCGSSEACFYENNDVYYSGSGCYDSNIPGFSSKSLVINVDRLDGRGGDAAGGMIGVFKMSDNFSFIDTYYSGGSYSPKVQLLAGVTSKVKSIKLYKYIGGGSPDKSSDQVPCNTIINSETTWPLQETISNPAGEVDLIFSSTTEANANAVYNGNYAICAFDSAGKLIEGAGVWNVH